MQICYLPPILFAIFLLIHRIDTKESLKRQQRAIPLLIFPPTAPTRVQWIAGIGIPLEDLLYEAMTTGYVFKAEYFLPDSVEKLRTITTMNITTRQLGATTFEQNLVDENDLKQLQNSTAENWFQQQQKQQKKVLSSYRWSVYKSLEVLANRIGLSGRACILKSICEAAETPFHYNNGMFGELLHILLTPSSSVDELSEHADNEYFQAEKLGRAGAECEHVFKDCGKSLLTHFSDVYTMTEDLSKFVG